MIRINLLPQAKRAAGGATAGVQAWAYLYLGAAIVWCIALAFVYFSLASDRDQALAQNAEVTRQIERVRTESGDLEGLKAQLEASRKVEDVVQRLSSARQGPTRMLLELSSILSPGRGPTVDPQKLEELRKTNPEAGFSPGWDTRRLWVSAFRETDSACTIAGEARNNEDIAEFLKRLSLSSTFDDVVLVRTGAPQGAEKLSMVSFVLGCKVRY